MASNLRLQVCLMKFNYFLSSSEVGKYQSVVKHGSPVMQYCKTLNVRLDLSSRF